MTDPDPDPDPGVLARAEKVLAGAGVRGAGYRRIVAQTAAFDYGERTVLAVAHAMAELARKRGEAR